jgi:hypothetical protein
MCPGQWSSAIWGPALKGVPLPCLFEVDLARGAGLDGRVLHGEQDHRGNARAPPRAGLQAPHPAQLGPHRYLSRPHPRRRCSLACLAGRDTGPGPRRAEDRGARTDPKKPDRARYHPDRIYPINDLVAVGVAPIDQAAGAVRAVARQGSVGHGQYQARRWRSLAPGRTDPRAVQRPPEQLDPPCSGP